MRKFDKIGTLAAAIIFLLGAMLLLTYFWLDMAFTNITLDVIFIHLFLHLKGADPHYYYSAALWVALVSLFCVFVLLTVWKSYRRPRIAWFSSPTFRLAFAIFSCVLLFGSSYLLERRYNAIAFFFPDSPFSEYMDMNYSLPRRSEFQLADGNNLILLILESTETSAVDEMVFNPVVMPRLKKLQETNATVFTNRKQTIGAESSISAYYAFSLGMPNRAVISARDMVKLFLGTTTNKELGTEIISEEIDYRDLSVFGFLEMKGYRPSLFCSAEAVFCELDTFMKHSTDDCDIRDYRYYYENDPEITGKQNGWGLRDSVLYQKAKEYMLDVQEMGQPFVMFMKTVGTHEPGNFEPGLPRPFGDFRDAYFQADIMAADFVEWIQAQPFGSNTTVFIVGDTLQASNYIGPVAMPPYQDRRVFATIINPRKPLPPGNENRLFTTFDCAATMLEAIGGELPDGRFGLGVSLYSDQPTLLEKDGMEKYVTNIVKRSKYIESIYIWGKPVDYDKKPVDVSARSETN